MRTTILSLATLMLAAPLARADEGMWVPALLDKMNISDMTKMGCKLTQEQIYSVNNSSIKDAVVIFGGGCTGEIVSDQGLLFTNYHCGYSAIQQLSSVTHNYLHRGFWAHSTDEELPVEGLEVRFFAKFEDVTDKVLEGIEPSADEKHRKQTISANIKKIKAEADSLAKGAIEFDVETYYSGNQYFLVGYEVYKDVRLVGAPPESIGKFGYDTDNWMWPRHTCDFSIFRVYASKDGKPAKFSTDNVPMKPKHFLPISLKGYKKGDFAMVMGFPGSTSRYLTSWGIDQRMNVENMSRIVPRSIKQNLWQNDMQADPKVEIQYSSKYMRSSNYWKNSIGMNRGIKNLNVIGQKQEIEKNFANWVNANADRKARYGTVLADLETAYANYEKYRQAECYLMECMLGGAEVYRCALSLTSLEKTLSVNPKANTAKQVASISEKLKAFYKDYNAPTDRKVVAALCELYKNSIGEEYWPEFFKTVVMKKYKGDFHKYASALFDKTMFADSAKAFDFLHTPNIATLKADMGFAHASQIMDLYTKIHRESEQYKNAIERGNRLFVAGLREMETGRDFYPDANFTMRLTYGTVGDYEPRDAVHYDFFTTSEGIMEKADSTNREFFVPEKLLTLFKEHAFGRYADADGRLHACFTTNNDITGGNSGSPVLNADGQLIGLAFDGNWEAMSGDIAFEHKLQKCICVDIRYVLYIIEKYGNAQNLIDELTIVD